MENKKKLFNFLKFLGTIVTAYCIVALINFALDKELSIIIGIASLILFVLFSWFFNARNSILSIVILVLNITVLMLIEHHFNLPTFFVIQFLMIIFGGVIGLLLQVKKYRVASSVMAFSIMVLVYAGLFLFPRIETDPNTNFTITDLQNSSSYLIGHQNENPAFHKDTVYLVNFSFQHCSPCRLKKKYLPQLEIEFKGKPFKIIEIHSFEEKQIFDESYMLDYPYVYHDSMDKLAKLYKISGGPEELIFNKKGKAVRRLGGFYKDIAGSYVDETKQLIYNLLKE